MRLTFRQGKVAPPQSAWNGLEHPEIARETLGFAWGNTTTAWEVALSGPALRVLCCASCQLDGRAPSDRQAVRPRAQLGLSLGRNGPGKRPQLSRHRDHMLRALLARRAHQGLPVACLVAAATPGAPQWLRQPGRALPGACQQGPHLGLPRGGAAGASRGFSAGSSEPLTSPVQVRPAGHLRAGGLSAHSLPYRLAQLVLFEGPARSTAAAPACAPALPRASNSLAACPAPVSFPAQGGAHTANAEAEAEDVLFVADRLLGEGDLDSAAATLEAGAWAPTGRAALGWRHCMWLR